MLRVVEHVPRLDDFPRELLENVVELGGHRAPDRAGTLDALERGEQVERVLRRAQLLERLVHERLGGLLHELALALKVGHDDLPVREPLRVEDVKLHAPRRAGHVRDSINHLVDRLGIAGHRLELAS